jgi:hypothetical protein
MPTNPQRRPALGLSRARFYRQRESEIDCASQMHRSLLSFGCELVADALRLFQRGAHDVSARHAPRRETASSSSESEAWQRKAATPGAMKPAGRFELSRSSLDAPNGAIVGSSNIGDTKEHTARCGVASTAGVPNSFHDALRQGQRVVDTYRDETGLDTHTHAPMLRLHIKRGAVILDGIHPRWQPLGTSPTTRSRQDAKPYNRRAPVPCGRR